MRNLILATALVLATSASADDAFLFIQEGDRPMDKARQDVIDFVNSSLEEMGDDVRFRHGDCQMRCINEEGWVEPCVTPEIIRCWQDPIFGFTTLDLKFEPLRICTWNSTFKTEATYRHGFTVNPPRKINFKRCKAD